MRPRRANRQASQDRAADVTAWHDNFCCLRDVGVDVGKFQRATESCVCKASGPKRTYYLQSEVVVAAAQPKASSSGVEHSRRFTSQAESNHVNIKASPPFLVIDLSASAQGSQHLASTGVQYVALHFATPKATAVGCLGLYNYLFAQPIHHQRSASFKHHCDPASENSRTTLRSDAPTSNADMVSLVDERPDQAPRLSPISGVTAALIAACLMAGYVVLGKQFVGGEESGGDPGVFLLCRQLIATMLSWALATIQYGPRMPRPEHRTALHLLGVINYINAMGFVWGFKLTSAFLCAVMQLSIPVRRNCTSHAHPARQ
eukprot:5109912-Pleurochrysis_carterae.AAC.2